MEEASSRNFITDLMVVGVLLATMWLTTDVDAGDQVLASTSPGAGTERGHER